MACPAGVCHSLGKMQQSVLSNARLMTQVRPLPMLLSLLLTAPSAEVFVPLLPPADHCMIEAVPMTDQHMSESHQDSNTQINLLDDMMAADATEVCSPVKRTPASERPAEDGFHRTFMPFDMLRSPTSLGGQSFQALNAHLAQNARLSTRQRNLRHDLRTATKEYVSDAGEHIKTAVACV